MLEIQCPEIMSNCGKIGLNNRKYLSLEWDRTRCLGDKRLLSVFPTPCKCSVQTSRNSVKISNSVTKSSSITRKRGVS